MAGLAKHTRFFFLFLIVLVSCQLLFNDVLITCLENISNAVVCHTTPSRNVLKTKECEAFPKDMSENIRVVENYRFEIDSNLLRSLELDKRGIDRLSRTKNVTQSLPVLVTAASENHFREAQALFENIHSRLLPKYPDLKIIFYDLGLREQSLHLLQKHCKCEVRKFSYKEYPYHVRVLFMYTWKPILIQNVLKEYSSIMWVDASVRFSHPNLESFFFNGSNLGIKLYPGDGSIARRTHLKTFEYLGEKPCMFDVPELEATVIMLKRSKFTLTNIMRPWVSCALSSGCMIHPCVLIRIWCPSGNQDMGCCHRFDQSVLGIILSRLFHYKRNMLHVRTDEIKVQRGNRSDYFYSLEWIMTISLNLQLHCVFFSQWITSFGILYFRSHFRKKHNGNPVFSVQKNNIQTCLSNA